MSSKNEMNRRLQLLESELAAARRQGEVQAAGNIFLTAVVKMQAGEIARLRIRLSAWRWPWHRRAWLKVRVVLRQWWSAVVDAFAYFGS